MDPKSIISMTELQKLSLKKLRKTKLPLFVLDRKSKSGGFVITHEASQSKQLKKLYPLKYFPQLNAYDFKAIGFFWDRPDMSNKKFISILKNETHSEYVWAISRLLERLSSQEVVKLFPLSTISEMLNQSKVRTFVRRPWEHAIHYFHQKASRYQ